MLQWGKLFSRLPHQRASISLRELHVIVSLLLETFALPQDDATRTHIRAELGRVVAEFLAALDSRNGRHG